MKPYAFVAGLLLLAGTSLQSQAGDDPQWWLERMSAAMNQMSYQGTFIYISGGRMETMRITHINDEHGAQERLVSVSGTHREVVRDNTGVKWMSGEDDSIMSDPVVNWPMFLDRSFRGLPTAAGNYELKLGERGRIAELSSQRVDIVANDVFRYGYSLWLESDSGLLLQWQLNDSSGNSLAKLAFTELKIGSEVDPKELKHGGNKKAAVESGLPVTSAIPISDSARWQPAWLPPGFRMTANRVPHQAGDGPYQHLVFSDGIASVSLYVEPIEDADNSGLGLRQVGTSHLFGLEADDVLITVVGDVPAITVRKIAKSVSQTASRPDP